MISTKTLWFALGSLFSLAAFVVTGIWLWKTHELEPLAGIFIFVSSFAFFVIRTNWHEFIPSGSPLAIVQREHDVAIFKQIDEIIPEWLVAEIDETVAGLQLCRDNYGDAMGGLNRFMAQEGNHFLNPHLRSKALEFNGAVDGLYTFIATHFFHTANMISRLYPDLYQRLDDGTDEEWLRWNRYAAELKRLSRDMRGTYSQFRQQVKKRLFM